MATFRRGLLHPLCWLIALTFLAPLLRADYPIASHRYLADPAVLVHDGRVYLYCSNDDENAVEGGYVMKSLVCVSSSDLKNWTDHGIVFRVPADASWAGFAWAPAIIARNGKFYLYFGNNASGIGVASGTSSTGPFTDAKGGYLINSATPGVLPAPNMWIFDPAVFIDDDEQAYLYFGGNGVNNVRVIKLNADMISTSGSAVTISTPNFFEAAWMNKRNGLYYLSYSANPSSGLTIDYLTSTDPMTAFTYRGTVAGQPPSNNNNNHHAIFVLNGSWYHAYHNRFVATQAGIPTTYRRNLGLERLEFNPDGTIQRIVYTTDGVVALATLNPYVRVEAETLNAQSGIETETTSAGGMNVRFAQNDTWTKIKGVDFGSAGAKTFTARVASASDGGSIEIRLGSATGTLVGTCSTSGTGGWQTWTTQSCPITGATGVQDVFLKFKAGSSTGLNVDWWRFDSNAAPTIVAPPQTQSVTAGVGASFSVTATSSSAITYQWLFNGAAIAGATNATYTIANPQAANMGDYAVVVSDANGAVTSPAAALIVKPAAADSRLYAISCRAVVGTGGDILIPGIIIGGTGSRQVVVRASGPALIPQGVSGTLARPQLQLYQVGVGSPIATNIGWDTGGTTATAALQAAFTASGLGQYQAGSADCALLATLNAGNAYTAHVSGLGAAPTGVALIEVYDLGSSTARMTALSCRAVVGTGGNILIPGIIVAGSSPKQLIIRASGPALAAQGVGGTLAQPTLAVYSGGTKIAENTGWSNVVNPVTVAAVTASVGLQPFPTGSADCTLVATLQPGGYTAQVSGLNSTTGVALIEVYEVP